MAKVIPVFILALACCLFPHKVVLAADNNVVTPVFIVRGRDFWRQGRDISHLKNLVNLVSKYDLSSSWLIQYDALKDPEILAELKKLPSATEFGLFLEVSRALADEAEVAYDWQNDSWSAARKVFLSGYEIEKRQKLISKAFDKFSTTFGYFPKSYGAWHVDINSMQYIKNKYGVDICLGLADQYSTDGYQVWGQYVNQPYFVSKYSSIEPGDKDSSIGVLKVLWAPRQQIMAFSRQKLFSNYSVQVNDYYRALKLDHEYFTSLLEQLTVENEGPVAQAVIGIEVSELESEYFPELERQIFTIKNDPKFKIQTLGDFNKLYRGINNNVSGPILSTYHYQDQLGYWYQSPEYRLGLKVIDNKTYLVDLRFYNTLDILDNDQKAPDKYANLYRVVPAIVDQISYGNSIEVFSELPEITKKGDAWIFESSSRKIILGANSIEFVGYDNNKLLSLNLPGKDCSGNLCVEKPKYRFDKPRCGNDSGWYDSGNVCLKSWLVSLYRYFPDIVYSKLSNQHYIGIRLNPTTLWGARVPNLKLGRMELPFNVLEYFLSLKKKLPAFSWLGRFELEPTLAGLKKDQLLEKNSLYGQEIIVDSLNDDKLYENSYYYQKR